MRKLKRFAAKATSGKVTSKKDASKKDAVKPQVTKTNTKKTDDVKKREASIKDQTAIDIYLRSIYSTLDELYEYLADKKIYKSKYKNRKAINYSQALEAVKEMLETKNATALKDLIFFE